MIVEFPAEFHSDTRLGKRYIAEIVSFCAGQPVLRFEGAIDWSSPRITVNAGALVVFGQRCAKDPARGVELYGFVTGAGEVVLITETEALSIWNEKHLKNAA